MGALSTRKGKVWERTLCTLFRAVGISAERNLEEVRGGSLGRDLIVSAPLCVQAKCGARPPIYGALREAEAAAHDNEIPVALVRRNGSGSRRPDDLAVMRIEDFIELIRPDTGRGCGATRKHFTDTGMET